MDLSTSKHHLIPLLALAVAIGCAESPTDSQIRKLEPAFSLNGGAFEFEPLAGSAVCRAPVNSPDYKPFDLPANFDQSIVATEIDDFRPVAGTGADTPDMLTLNESGPYAGRYLYRTHEVGSNGAVTVTDLVSGVTSLVSQETHYEALDGIAWTPWNTLIFAEERVVASRRDPRVPNAVGGLVYEYNPATGQVQPLPAVGARSHEGLRFDAQGNLYGISESTQGINGSGGIFKFVPDRRGDLTSGQLYVLKVLDASRTGEAVWVALDRDSVKINSDSEALRKGATGWGRPEDVEIGTSTGNNRGGNGVMYVAVTSEDLVLRVELDGDKAYVSNYVKNGVNSTGMTDPDNLALDPFGNLYIAEDRSQGDIFVARAGHGGQRAAQTVERFASLSDCSAEPTGIYFDRNGKTLWVHVQHAGGPLGNDLLMAIQRR